MTEKIDKKKDVVVTEGNPSESEDSLLDSPVRKFEKGRKRIIFTLMVTAFLGCMYLLFGPSKETKIAGSTGLNENVPQAADESLQSDKQKAYEQQMLDTKEQERKKGLISLSDYWNSESINGKDSTVLQNTFGKSDANDVSGVKSNSALDSYRNMQSTLSTFYQQEAPETEDLRREVEELKAQLLEKEDPPAVNSVENQLELMEKSYQMAAKYLPVSSMAVEPPKKDSTDNMIVDSPKASVLLQPMGKDVVSALYREASDSVFMAKGSGQRNRGFYTVGASRQIIQPKNSIRACIQEAQTISGESGVRLRLLENARIPSQVIPKGTLLTAHTKFQSGRLQLEITSVEVEGNIIPLNLKAYDLDGQKGLSIPGSQEMKALSEMASNMSQTSGTSIMMSRSAGQQVAGDLSRGVIQGLSGYLSKKIGTPKIRLKAGYQLFLVSEK